MSLYGLTRREIDSWRKAYYDAYHNPCKSPPTFYRDAWELGVRHSPHKSLCDNTIASPFKVNLNNSLACGCYRVCCC